MRQKTRYRHSRAGRGCRVVRVVPLASGVVVGRDTGVVHWDGVYDRSAATAVSWYQTEPTVSLELLAEVGVAGGSRVVDVGGGASELADRLLDRGVAVTVLDVAEAALRTSAERLGDRADRVTWVVQDLLSWTPSDQHDVWHDRAVFHFLTDPADRDRYRQVLDRALRPGGDLVIGTFAEDGPTTCSGLTVARYSTAELAAQFPSYDVVASRREEHHTPGDAVQPFTWLVLRKRRQPPAM
jgi:SAM-dependent methyltransferase